MTWKPPAGLAPGTYPVQVAATSYAGKKATVTLAPVVVALGHDAAALIAATLSGTTLTWQATTPARRGSRSRVDLVDPNGVNPPQTLDLGQQPTSGSAALGSPPGTWQATLRATNSAGLTATVPSERSQDPDNLSRRHAAPPDRPRAVAVLVVGVVAAVVIHRLQGEGNIRGSSTEEFTLPTRRPKPPPPPGRRGRSTASTRRTTARSQLALRPPFRKVWAYGAGSLVEFPPSIGYGRLYFSTNSGKFAAVNMKTGKRAWKSPRIAASPRRPRSARTSTAPCTPCSSTSRRATRKRGEGRRQGDRVRRGLREDPLAEDDRAVRELAAPASATGSTSPTGTAGLGARRAHRADDLAASPPAARSRAPSPRVGASLRRLVRRPRLLPRRAEGAADLEGAGAAPPLRALALLLDARARVRPRLHRLDRRQGLLVRCDDGTLLWSHATGGYVYSSPAVWNGLVFAGSYSKRFYAFDAATGDVRWTFRRTAQISGLADRDRQRRVLRDARASAPTR